jgi:hypothetical protein
MRVLQKHVDWGVGGNPEKPGRLRLKTISEELLQLPMDKAVAPCQLHGVLYFRVLYLYFCVCLFVCFFG